MSNVALVGAGLIGRGWAVAFAGGGAEVKVWDADTAAAQRLLAWLDLTLADMDAAGLLREPPTDIRARVHVDTTLEAAVGEADYVQESVPERLEAKREVFARMDAAAPPGCVLASSASAIRASLFTEHLAGRARCLVAHPANPPHLMPVVELVPAPWTDAATLGRAREVLEQAGQVPVLLHKEIEGFVMNRLQTAVIGEAMYLVDQGVIDPDDLDKVMRYSLGRRWSFMGPFETMELNAPGGFLDYATRYGEAYASMAAQLHVADPWPRRTLERIEADRRARYPASEVPRRQAWRDRRLMALLALDRESEP